MRGTGGAATRGESVQQRPCFVLAFFLLEALTYSPPPLPQGEDHGPLLAGILWARGLRDPVTRDQGSGRESWGLAVARRTHGVRTRTWPGLLQHLSDEGRLQGEAQAAFDLH